VKGKLLISLDGVLSQFSEGVWVQLVVSIGSCSQRSSELSKDHVVHSRSCLCESRVS